MAAATQDVVRVGWSLPELSPSEHHTQTQSTTLYAGAVAMVEGGSGNAEPLTASPAAGSRILGVNVIQSVAPTTGDLTFPDEAPLVFKRGVFGFLAEDGDEPTDANIQGPVYFADDSTIRATDGGTDLSGTLRAIRDGFYWVEI